MPFAYSSNTDYQRRATGSGELISARLGSVRHIPTCRQSPTISLLTARPPTSRLVLLCLTWLGVVLDLSPSGIHRYPERADHPHASPGSSGKLTAPRERPTTRPEE